MPLARFTGAMLVQCEGSTVRSGDVVLVCVDGRVTIVLTTTVRLVSTMTNE